ncbi:hypothetical protein ACFL5A_00650, partial [Gemmatimonadota bacterium]
ARKSWGASWEEALEPAPVQERNPMTDETLEGWLRDRVPPVPETFLPSLLREVPENPAGPGELAQRGETALSRALASPGRNRDSAFHLLVGDAYLTYACEAMARSEDEVGPALESYLRQLGTRIP